MRKALAIHGEMWYSPLRQLNKGRRGLSALPPDTIISWLACQGRGKERESYEEETVSFLALVMVGAVLRDAETARQGPRRTRK